MPTLSINKQYQAQITIPKELVEVLGWSKGDQLLISKAPGKKYLIIENIKKGDTDTNKSFR